MRAELSDLQAIADTASNQEVDFESIIAAYDRAGSLLGRVGAVFGNMCSSLNTAELQAIQTTMAPVMSRHTSETYQTPGLFDKINAVYQKRLDMGLTDEQIRLTERIHTDFTRAGAALDQTSQVELADLQAELASLSTQFQQNVMKDEEMWGMELQLSDLTGCPPSLVEAVAAAASERGNTAEDKYVITLSRSLVEPFLTTSDRRDLRQRAWKAWVSRGEMDASRNNTQIAQDMLKIRQRVANIHGYPSFAAYRVPTAWRKLLPKSWSCSRMCGQGPENPPIRNARPWKSL
jgi:peptidyl-dipeptidase Dcp